MIFSNSPSAVQALGKFKTGHPLPVQIQDMLHEIDVDQKEIVLVWDPGHAWYSGR